MLSAMRSRAGGIFAKLLLGLLVLTFGVWGIGDIFRHGNTGALVKVDNERISEAEYEEALAREMEGVRRALGDRYNADLAKSMGIEYQVLRNLINNILIRKEAHHLDIVVGDDQIVKKIKTNAAFQNDKFVFDKTLFQSALLNMRTTEGTFVDSLKLETAGNIINTTFLSTDLVTPALAEAVYAARNEQRVADIYVISPSGMKGLPTPSAEELNQYHSQHGKDFTAPEYRNLSYITLDPAALKAKGKIQAGEQEDEAIYKAAKELEDDLAGGATMEEAAAKFGLAAKKTGPLDAQGKDPQGKPLAGLPKLNNFLKLAFSLDERAESPVTLSREGINFLVRTDAIIPEHVRPLEEVKSEVLAGWQKQAKAAQLHLLAQQTAADLKEGKSVSITPTSTGPIARDELHMLKGENTPLPAPLLEEIFHLAPNIATPPYALGNGGYAIAVTRKIIPFTAEGAAAADKQKALKQITQSLTKNYHDELYGEYMGYLSHKYSIHVNEDALKAITSPAP